MFPVVAKVVAEKLVVTRLNAAGDSPKQPRENDGLLPRHEENTLVRRCPCRRLIFLERLH